VSESPARARELAHQILSRAPFAHPPSHAPNPLGGFFSWLGRGLRFVFGGFFSWLGHHVFAPVANALAGDDGIALTVVTAVLLLGLGGLVAWLLWRARTTRAATDAVHHARPPAAVDADELDRRADAAAAAGDFTHAVRLRFEAGVQRLTERGVVVNGRTRTNHQLDRALHSDVFTELVATHERVVYGEETATPDDAARAAWGWSEVVRSATRTREPIGAGVP